ncbi:MULTISPECIES: CDP-alcohol phosphatidyltransferase family protein [Mammaliicoccus]|uniref:CDP-alcohol phosphatidyltransferase family protein n=1 Tax=Mammaliicoccus sciuri TaxID=1296 RepID=A0ABT7HX44_MAMSC|nr:MULTISPECIES: CDP-alcohol phosphatidyltransferase family protein [Mammaliicoccus]MCJ0915137.1 CDP-alcohol phosphatidyltransferase family protein [Mammaliicoccus sciuri]MCJ1749294.1 CDP-alcohol phosphatidyltransferase family protein [Mammaliicoccus sciuri]MDL0113168.1 CDP-alcohol phosphatidyltransferase family protein [Mammaliicoccus sciuri]MDL0116620.1 CDP-alcohol phosphatidyltransferase family protein [Mammaliicoccus sciuri]WQJ66543.1 CDP-alcohol phosphatidyltransferase family protein [Mam
MISIYEIKPKFQQLLMPIVDWMRKIGMTPNQVTILALLLSIVTGIIISIFHENKWIYILMPIVMFVRMALNAIDGVMAKKYQMKSHLGLLLNELGDVISDLFLFIPFVFIAEDYGIGILLFISLSIISEMAGVTVQVIGSSRRYDGPMGKSDRAFIIGFISFLIFVHLNIIPYLHFVFYVCSILMLINIYNRITNGLKEVKS